MSPSYNFFELTLKSLFPKLSFIDISQILAELKYKWLFGSESKLANSGEILRGEIAAQIRIWVSKRKFSYSRKTNFQSHLNP